MGPTCIRLAADADFDAIAAITNHYIRTTAIHFGSDDVTADEQRASWREHAELYPWLVAEADGACVAFAKAGVWRARAAYRWTPETGIYVHPDRLGRGLGRPLYARLVAVCREQGFHSLIAGIALPNTASERLHAAVGFVPIGTARDAGHKFDRWWDVAFWQLSLAAAGSPVRALTTPALAFART